MSMDMQAFIHIMHAALADVAAQRERKAREERYYWMKGRLMSDSDVIEGECVEVPEVKQLPYDGKPTWFD